MAVFRSVKSGHCKNRRMPSFSMSNSDVDCGCRENAKSANPQPTNPATTALAKIMIRFSRLIFICARPFQLNNSTVSVFPARIWIELRCGRMPGVTIPDSRCQQMPTPFSSVVVRSPVLQRTLYCPCVAYLLL